MMGMRSRACVMTCLWLTKSRSGGIMGTCTCWRLMTKTMRSNVWNGKLTHLIDRRRDLGSGNELLKLLTGEITNANGFGEPHILALFHAFPQRLYVNRKKIFFWNWYLRISLLSLSGRVSETDQGIPVEDSYITPPTDKKVLWWSGNR